jgi:23S rRNA-/tRNA-specific pseudouridylate synthase
LSLGFTSTTAKTTSYAMATKATNTEPSSDNNVAVVMSPGTPLGFFVTKHYTVKPSCTKDWLALPGLDQTDIGRIELTPGNITLPVALMLLEPDLYPSLSRARKACRKGSLMVHRGPLVVATDTGQADHQFDPAKCVRGRVGERVYPGDVVAKQVRMGDGNSPTLSYRKPPFELPVLFEDDYFALVNKPAGVVVYNQGGGGHGVMTVQAALPFVVQPPRAGSYSVLRRPAVVHRLDKPTSGILCVAKTKPAMQALSRQFHDRCIKKTYIALVNGIPRESSECAITSKQAIMLGLDIDPMDDSMWQLIDSPLEGKSAVTLWRPLRYVKSLHANDGYLTLVEVKPKTGRYHQIRRHMAWVCQRPLVGDDEYDGGTLEAMKFRERGLFLCSSRLLLEHPFYNSVEGQSVWSSLDEESKYASGKLRISNDGRVMVEATVELPAKFESLLRREGERFNKFS